MKLSDLPYPHRLCVELMYHAIFLCDKTKDMKCAEVMSLIKVFFEEKVIDECSTILSGGSLVHKAETLNAKL